MADSQKLVLMIQPTRLQGLIWQAVLRSQQISVIWESPEADLVENLTQLQTAGLTLPNLLLIDIRMSNFNPYAFCRWCRDNYPDIMVILINASQREISPPERQWAIHQGAMDLLPGFHLDNFNLVSSVSSQLKLVLKTLNNHELDNGAFISVLLSIKRDLESRRAGLAALPSINTSISSPISNGSAKPNASAPSLTAHIAPQRSSNGALSTTHNGNAANPTVNNNSTSSMVVSQSAIAPYPSTQAPAAASPPVEPPPATDEPQQIVRKYRGKSY
jgi:CheY-like chemotaxis protein